MFKYNINFVYSYLPLNIITTIMTSLLWQYSNIRVFLEENYNYVYKHNKYIKTGIDYAFSIQKYTKKKIFGEICEPEEQIWNNYITLIEKNEQYNYVESYEILDSVIHNETQYIDSMKSAKEFLDITENKNHCCLLSKYKDAYYVRNSPIELDKNEYFQKTNLDILSVVYSHPKMETKIHVELPKCMLYCHNQLFNAAFVYHCLKYYNKEPFVFDEQYNIEIMDSNVETINIKYNEHLYIHLDKLEVIAI